MPREDYDAFEKNDANYVPLVPLSPLSFIRRSAEVHGDHTAVIHGSLKRTWGETYRRCVQLGHALSKLGITRNDTVSFLCPNTPEMVEAHFGVNMSGANRRSFLPIRNSRPFSKRRWRSLAIRHRRSSTLLTVKPN